MFKYFVWLDPLEGTVESHLMISVISQHLALYKILFAEFCCVLRVFTGDWG